MAAGLGRAGGASAPNWVRSNSAIRDVRQRVAVEVAPSATIGDQRNAHAPADLRGG